MPIAQDRLINLIAIADGLVTTIDTMHELAAHENIAELRTLANGTLDHVEDPAVQHIIMQLLQSVTILHELITNVHVPHGDRDTITTERTHYRKHEKINNYRKNYLRVIRAQQKGTGQSAQQVPKFFASTDDNYLWPEPGVSPYAPKPRVASTKGIATNKPLTPEQQAENQRHIEQIWGKDAADKVRADAEAKAVAMPLAPPPIQTNGTVLTGEYMPGRKANLPTLEELNAKDYIAPGDDVL